jgi:hypothetical protein
LCGTSVSLLEILAFSWKQLSGQTLYRQHIIWLAHKEYEMGISTGHRHLLAEQRLCQEDGTKFLMMGILDKYCLQPLLINVTYEVIKHKDEWLRNLGQPFLARHTRMDQNTILLKLSYCVRKFSIGPN